jgi:hypothetical protein
MIMGLDNGFEIRSKSYDGDQFLEEFGQNHPDFVKQYSGGKYYELAYWRKCYNVRHKIFDSFPQLEDAEGGTIKISELPKLKGIMTYFLTKKNWLRDGSSIWTWEQQLRNTADIIYLITEFMEDIEDAGITDDDIEIEFYYSY